MSETDQAFKGAPLRVEIKISRHRLESGLWMAEAYAFWVIGGGESCACLGATDYVHATRGEAASAVAGLAERWLAENA